MQRRGEFRVSVSKDYLVFASAHFITFAGHRCEGLHGHNYRVRVTVEGPQLDSIGLLVDFVHVKQIIREVMGRLDHQFMNDLEPFKSVNPSAENVAKYFYDEITKQLKGMPPGAKVTEVVLWETDMSRAQYRPGV